MQRRAAARRPPRLDGPAATICCPGSSVVGNVTLGARLRGERAGPRAAPGAARPGRPRRPARPAAGDALGRPAPARGARAHADGGPPGGADGRAVLGARRDHPRPPPGARRAAARRAHRAAGDPRPAGGAPARPSHPGDGRPAGAHRGADLPRRRAAPRPARPRAAGPPGRAARRASPMRKKPPLEQPAPAPGAGRPAAALAGPGLARRACRASCCRRPGWSARTLLGQAPLLADHAADHARSRSCSACSAAC